MAVAEVGELLEKMHRDNQQYDLLQQVVSLDMQEELFHSRLGVLRTAAALGVLRTAAVLGVLRTAAVLRVLRTAAALPPPSAAVLRVLRTAAALPPPCLQRRRRPLANLPRLRLPEVQKKPMTMPCEAPIAQLPQLPQLREATSQGRSTTTTSKRATQTCQATQITPNGNPGGS